MKRKLRLTLAVALGLTLGWTASGMLQGYLPGTTAAAMAEAVDHDAGDESDTAKTHTMHHDSDNAEDAKAHGTASHDNGEAHGDLEVGKHQAANLVPKGDEATAWYGSVLNIAALLFVAALAIGCTVLALKGPEPPDASHDADAHHDEHGGGHGAHH